MENGYIRDMKRVRAKACSNIAIIKYWGKRDPRLNLPAVGSISLTLKELYSTTDVMVLPDADKDEVIINGENEGKSISRVVGFLEGIRYHLQKAIYFKVISENNFPTGAGLASSASGFAALAASVARAAGMNLSPTELSILARKGSGSAARSVFGGIVEMQKGEKDDGSDCYAFQLYDESYWDLRVLVVITSEEEKKIKSTEGMELTRKTSPYYNDWIATHPDDINEAKFALENKDFTRLGDIIEHNCFKMHATMISSRPALVYWNALTVELIHFVRELRSQNIQAYVTIDAGPQVKIITLPEYVQTITDKLQQVSGIRRIIQTSLGPGVQINEEDS